MSHNSYFSLSLKSHHEQKLRASLIVHRGRPSPSNLLTRDHNSQLDSKQLSTLIPSKYFVPSKLQPHFPLIFNNHSMFLARASATWVNKRAVKLRAIMCR